MGNIKYKRGPNGVTKAGIYYILTNRTGVVTDVTVINQDWL